MATSRFAYQFLIDDEVVRPVFKDDAALEYELYSEQWFFRKKFSDKLTFVRDAVDYINAQDFEHEFILTIQISYDNEKTWAEYYSGNFYKTDCEFDEDNGIITASVQQDDQYSDVLAGIDDEYDLIDIATPRRFFQYDRRPLLQVYILGDSTISCFLTGNNWEQTVNFEVDDESTLTGTYKFIKAKTFEKWLVESSDDSLRPEAAIGEYTESGSGNTSWEGYGGDYRIDEDTHDTYNFNTDGAHGKSNVDYNSLWLDDQSRKWILVNKTSSVSKIELRQFDHNGSYLTADLPVTFTHLAGAENTDDFTVTTVNETTETYRYYLVDTNASDEVLIFNDEDLLAAVSSPQETVFVAVPGTDAEGEGEGFFEELDFYTRYIMDRRLFLSFDLDDGYELPDSDITENYGYAYGFNENAFSSITMSQNTTEDETEYGLSDNDEYFDKPDEDDPWLPIARSRWGYTSFWLASVDNDTAYNYDLFGREAILNKDAFTLYGVIYKLLQEIDSTIQHENTEEYSEFLYGTNPVTNEQIEYLITQKTNIKEGEYDKPAQQAPTTLQNILTMLQNTMQVFWYIDEDKKFKLEHIIWFKNGGTYLNAGTVGTDLTMLCNPRSSKPLSDLQNKYSYEKPELISEYNFGWMDTVTKGFEGYAIEVNSDFVDEDETEDVNAGDFTSDIDFVTLNPDSISDDGFCLVAAKTDPIYPSQVSADDVGDSNLSDTVINEDGTTSSDTSFNTSYRIPVFERRKYSIEFGYRVAFYEDDGETVISAIDVSGTGATVRPPTDSRYMRVCTTIGSWESLFVTPSHPITTYYEEQVDGYDYRLQNGYMSYLYMHPRFWTYNLPSTDVTINEEAATVLGLVQAKIQEVSFPAIADVDPLELIRTGLGDGKPRKLSINLKSRKIEATLQYDTE